MERFSRQDKSGVAALRKLIEGAPQGGAKSCRVSRRSPFTGEAKAGKSCDRRIIALVFRWETAPCHHCRRKTNSCQEYLPLENRFSAITERPSRRICNSSQSLVSACSGTPKYSHVPFETPRNNNQSLTLCKSRPRTSRHTDDRPGQAPVTAATRLA